MRVLIGRSLRRHGYPPDKHDKQERTTQTALEQPELFSEVWARAA
jgi:type I restriction enzyme, R subunit